MLVWPPMPLQPRRGRVGPEVRPLADRLALPMMIAPAAFSCAAMNASSGVLPASAHEPAGRRHAGRVDVVLDDDRDPEQRPVVAVAARLVRGARVGEGRRADRDHRVEHRVQLPDALEIELGQAGRSSAGASPSAPAARGSSSRRRRCRRPWCSSGWPPGRSAPRRRTPRAGVPAEWSEQGNAEVGFHRDLLDLVGCGAVVAAARLTNVLRSRLRSPTAGMASVRPYRFLPSRGVLG